MTADHYDVLGVDAGASHETIRAAYRRLMRQHHPDLRPGDEAAGHRAREITAAWSVVGRPAAREAYDRRRRASRGGMPVVARAATAVTPAYSAEGNAFRRAFHLASLRVAMAVMSVGVVLLVTLSR